MKKVHTSERLKQLMKERNLKQVDIVNISLPLCERYQERIGRNDISQYISGKVEPGQRKLFILAKALNVNESWLMGYDSPMERSDILSEKKNDTISDIILRLRSDDRFREIIDSLCKLSDEQLTVVETMLSAFKQQNIDKMD